MHQLQQGSRCEADRPHSLVPATIAASAAIAVLAIGHHRRRTPPPNKYIGGAAVCEACVDSEQSTAEPPEPPLRRGSRGHDPPRSPVGPTPSAGGSVPTPRQALIACCDEHSVGLTKDSNRITRRENYIDWNDYFMSVAMLSAYRSKDPSRQVGACIVDPSTKRIVGIGYNGFPWGCSDEKLPWARKADSWLDTKYPYVCHAELNAIMNKNTASLEGCAIYTTLFPCNECAKLIVQSRMVEVVYLSDAQINTDPNTA